MTKEQVLIYLRSSGFSEEQIETIIDGLTPKGEMISRQDAIDVVRRYCIDNLIEDGDYHTSGIEYELNSLPSADASLTQDRCKVDASSGLMSRQDTQDLIDEYIETAQRIKCKDAEDMLMDLADDVKNLPSAERKGKWIRHNEVKNVYGGIYIECSECGEKYVVQHIEDEKYCRHCGADMRSKLRQTTDTDGYADQSGLASAT